MALALKIIGVVCIVNVARQVTSLATAILWAMRPSVDFTNILIGIVPAILLLVLLLVIGYLLVVWSDRLAARLVSAEAALPELSTLTFGKKTFAFALRIVGTLALIRGLSYATTAGTRVMRSADWPFPYPWSWPANAVLYCIIGIYLLTGAKHVVNFAYRNRQPEGLSDVALAKSEEGD